jgi:hypothetical protein
MDAAKPDKGRKNEEDEEVDEEKEGEEDERGEDDDHDKMAIHNASAAKKKKGRTFPHITKKVPRSRGENSTAALKKLRIPDLPLIGADYVSHAQKATKIFLRRMENVSPKKATTTGVKMKLFPINRSLEAFEFEFKVDEAVVSCKSWGHCSINDIIWTRQTWNTHSYLPSKRVSKANIRMDDHYITLTVLGHSDMILKALSSTSRLLRHFQSSKQRRYKTFSGIATSW